MKHRYLRSSAGVLGVFLMGISMPSHAEEGELAVFDGSNSFFYSRPLVSTWSPDGRYVVTGQEAGAVLLWDMQSTDFVNEPIISHVHGYVSNIAALAWSPNGQFLAVGTVGGALEIWRMDAESGSQLEKRLSDPSFEDEAVWALAWSPDSTLLASGTGGSEREETADTSTSKVLIWDMAPESEHYGTVQTQLCEETAYRIFSLSWSSDGTRLAAGCGQKEKVYVIYSISSSSDFGNGKVMIWNVDTQSDTFGAELFASTQKPSGSNYENVFSVAWSPDGNCLAAGMGQMEIAVDSDVFKVWATKGECILWDMNPNSATFETSFYTQHKAISQVSWSPDGRYLATGFYAPFGVDLYYSAFETAASTVLEGRIQSVAFGDILQSTADSSLKNTFCVSFSPVSNQIAIGSEGAFSRWTLSDDFVRTHSADTQPMNAPNQELSLHELLRVIQIFNTGAYQCSDERTEDGYALGMREGNACRPHDSDYNPQNWRIEISELLRIIQLYNAGGYRDCSQENTPHEADGYCLP